jgi:CRISPR/Cas system-associated exonuclease Cas4 (RecB family)
MIFKKLGKALKLRPAVAFVQKALDDGVKRLDAERQHTPSGFFNVSDFGYCLRQVYFRHTAKSPFPPGLLKKFGAGVDAGQRVVRCLQKAEILYGSYYCASCGRYNANCVIPATCGCDQGQGGIVYSELGIRNLKRKISGKVDVFVQHSKVILGEVKSASTYYKLMDKKNIALKLRHNIQQANMYVGMIRSHLRNVEKGRESPFVFTDTGTGALINGATLGRAMDTSLFLMIYEDKNTSEHHVHEFAYDHNMYLEDIETVKSFYKFLEAKTRPPKPSDTKQCKYCDYVDLCNQKGA